MRLTRRKVYWLLLTKEPLGLVPHGGRLILGLAVILGTGAALAYGVRRAGVTLWDEGPTSVLLLVAGVFVVCAGRAAEVDGGHATMSCPHPTRGVCVLQPFFDAAVRRMGYLHENPFAQRVLTGPLGDRVNVVELAARAERGSPTSWCWEGR
ncbi:MAG: hypothetical protein HOW59_23760 [Nonomuraea sp.]|nr:hypothetical protein [Nonomuraea sp.]